MHTRTCIVTKALLICMKILEILRYMLRWSQGTANRSILHSVCVLHDFLNILLHALLLLLLAPLHLLPLLLPLLLLFLAILSTDSVLGHHYAKCTGLLLVKIEILLYRFYIYHRHMPQSKIVFESPSVTVKANLVVQMDGPRSSPIPMQTVLASSFPTHPYRFVFS